MRKKIVAGNWKMNTTLPEAEVLVEGILALKDQIPADVNLIVCPPFTHLSLVSRLVKDAPVALGAQNCADKASGAYTGEVSASMLASVPCRYVILGHSERRQYYGENSDTLYDKCLQALANGLIPIFCVGERLEEREAGRHFEIVGKQLQEVIAKLTPEDFAKIIIAYEPVWAIGTGKTATAEQAQEIHAFIRATLAETFGEAAAHTSILYGGSCKPSNAKEIFAKKDVDGGLIGGAALKASDFIALSMCFS